MYRVLFCLSLTRWTALKQPLFLESPASSTAWTTWVRKAQYDPNLFLAYTDIVTMQDGTVARISSPKCLCSLPSANFILSLT